MTSCSKENEFEPLKNDEPIFVAVARNDPEMNQAFIDANEHLSRFHELLESPEHTNSFMCMKIKIKDEEFSKETGEDEFTYLWLNNIRRDKDGYLGYIFELPEGGINDLNPDSWIWVDESCVCDWMVQTPEGHLWGGYTIRVMREKIPLNQRAEFDEYQGITEYK